MPLPKLYIWNGEILFLGTVNIPHKAHRVVQEKLLICLEGEFRFHNQTGETVTSRTCLLGNGILLNSERVEGPDTVIAVVYLAPFTQDYPAIASTMTPSSPGVHYGHPREEDLIEQLRLLRDGPLLAADQTYQLLRGLMIPEETRHRMFREFDPRVLDVVSHIRTNMQDNTSLSELAGHVNLSESRLEKLFKDQTGVPITQYRVRCRVFTAVVLVALGHTITDAALMTGFSSTAHFSRKFSAVNGFAPSTTFLRSPLPETVVDEETARLIHNQIGEELTI